MEFRVAGFRDMGQVSDVADRVFRSARPGHMADEFPHLYDGQNACHWWIAEEAGHIVSIVGAMVWTAVLGGAPVVMASVGSVATDADFRRQGISTRLLLLAESCLRDEGVRLLLISGDGPLYLRFGARPVGWVEWYALPKTFVAGGSFEIKAIDPVVDAVEVARLYRSRGTRFLRPLPLLQGLLRAQSFTAVSQGVKVAFCAYERGRAVSYASVNHRPGLGRRPSQLAEWAGDPNGVLYGLTHLSDWPESGMTVPVLPEDQGLRGALSSLEPARQTPFPWLAKVVDGVGLGRDLEAVWAESTGDPPQIKTQGVDRYRVTRGVDAWELDAAALTQMVFGYDVPERPASMNDVWPSPAPWPTGLHFI